MDCSNSRCSTAGNHCRNSTRPDACCGGFMCEGTETLASCELDCAPDADGDGFLEYGDCDDTDPLSGAVPEAIPGMRIQDLGGGGYQILWDSVSFQAGTSTVYDLFSGLASTPLAPGGLQRGSCLSDDLAATDLLDPTGVPPIGDAF